MCMYVAQSYLLFLLRGFCPFTKMWKLPTIVLSLAILANADDMHERESSRSTARNMGALNSQEFTADYWNDAAQNFLKAKLEVQPNTKQAKNVILFLGDGMSVSTLKAARVYHGQRQGKTGEEDTLFFETFPYSGLARTYCVNTHVPDSACTATAYLCGVKSNYDTAGVTATVDIGDCEASLKEENRVDSIARWFQLSGKKSGLITTTRVTHATPSGVYAHTAHREWERDKNPDGPELPKACDDIAVQLVTFETGRNLNVILGGGRGKFLPLNPKNKGDEVGDRVDGRNLINEWLQEKESRQVNSKYVRTRSELLSLPKETDYVLGLFAKSDCPYNLEAGKEDPSLEEMTEAAINVLSNKDKGYFLLVEGARIDHAHHGNHAKKALDETIEFDKAIKKAFEVTNKEDTLIVVTADHSHVFVVNGYPSRGKDILGLGGTDKDKKAYTVLSYTNGPGYKEYVNNTRPEIEVNKLHDNNYRFPAMIPRRSATHSGDDVAIFATGPWAHLFTGSLEQNYIPHAMAFAACVGRGDTMCQRGGAITISVLPLSVYALLSLVYCFFFN